MEHFDFKFNKAVKPPFDAAPEASRRRAFGVDYLHLRGLQSGDLFVTRDGWPRVESLLPAHWFTGERFHKAGRALAGATGAVYRVPVPHPARGRVFLVVKFSRAAQDVRVTFLGGAQAGDEREQELAGSARFLSPFEEFGNLMRLRADARGRILTKRPLAIYSPPTRHLEWQLGRKAYICHDMSEALARSQEGAPPERRIVYEWERVYILLYGWIEGVDAEQAMGANLISREEMVALGRLARDEMRAAGWMVCDHKPRHVILRQQRGGGGILRRRGRAVWALVDYELLSPLA